MWQIQFEYTSNIENTALRLQPGKYTAQVEALNTQPLQYRVFNLQYLSGALEMRIEDQLILFKQQKEGLDVYDWREAFNNTSNELVQLIGKEIEKVSAA